MYSENHSKNIINSRIDINLISYNDDESTHLKKY